MLAAVLQGPTSTYSAPWCAIAACLPITLLPANVSNMGVSVYTDLEAGIEGCDIVMMLRLQTERMAGANAFAREYFNLFGLDSGKLCVQHQRG